MREQLVAWAGDCVVRGSVDLGEGRISDRVNETEVMRFFDATVRVRRWPRGGLGSLRSTAASST